MKRLLALMGLVALTLNAQTRDAKMEEANKKVVLAFMQEFFGDHDIAAAEKYLAPEYIQHNPGVADGRAAIMAAAKGFFGSAPKSKTDVRHVAADGDLVWLHHRAQMGPGASAVVDIFRVKNGKIVEHWDVIQSVPDKAANPHPMF